MNNSRAHLLRHEIDLLETEAAIITTKLTDMRKELIFKCNHRGLSGRKAMKGSICVYCKQTVT